MTRLEQLLRFAQDEPNDPFNIYAVAIEYLKLDSAKALSFFETLVKDHPEYLPTYYTFGKMLQQEKDFARAKQLFEKGIEQGVASKNMKAVGELKNALSELTFEMEDEL
jgi:tetratricopeptide (TPR) repeat protein